MKKSIILLASILLLSGCNNNDNTNKDEQKVDPDSIVDPVTPDEDTSIVDPVTPDEDTLFANFEKKLKSLEGHINSSATNLTSITQYKSGDAIALETLWKETYTTTRYTYNDSFVVETNGVSSSLEDDGVTVSDSSNFKIQIYDDSTKFYKVTKYENSSWSSDDSSIEIDYTKEGVELNYNIGFSQSDINDIEALKQYRNNVKYDYSYTNFEGNIVDNKLTYSYEINYYTIYDGGNKAITQKISFENTLYIENNIVVSLTKKCSNILYAAEIPTNCYYNTYEISYTQGEYSTFSGTLLPHN